MGAITGTAAPDFKNAFTDMATSVLAGAPDTAAVHVVFGEPGTYEADDIVSVNRVTTSAIPAAMGPKRPREEKLELTVTISCYRGGGEEMERVCSDRAYALLRILAEQVHHVDTTLGGVVRLCFLADTDSDGSTDPDLIAKGRAIAVKATFTAEARVTN